MTTHLVVLSVVVTDKSGNPVTNLNRGDFRVLENDQEQAINSFEAANLPGGEANAAVNTTPATGNGVQPRSQPRIILVLDELNTISADIMYAAEEMQRYLKAQPRILQQPTSIYLLTKKHLEPFAELTQDRDGLLAKLKTRFIELPPHYLDSGGVQGGADRLVASLMALDEVALANADQKGRKNILWIGNGIPILSDVTISGDDRAKFEKWVHYTANWLEQTQTTVYTIDPRGVEVSPTTISTGGFPTLLVGPDLTAGELVFEAIAPESGGAIIRHRNDIDGAIAKAVSDGGSGYTLSYYPTDHNWDGGFRRIEVKLRSSGLTARTQHGYYAYPDGFEGQSEQIDFALSRAVTSPVAFKSISFRVNGIRLTGAQPKNKGQTSAGTARLILAIDRDGLTWEPEPNGDQRAEVTLVDSELSVSGSVLAYKVREVELMLTNKQGPNDPAKLSVRVDVPAKTDRIRMVLRDATTGHLGTLDLPAAALVASNMGGH